MPGKQMICRSSRVMPPPPDDCQQIRIGELWKRLMHFDLDSKLVQNASGNAAQIASVHLATNVHH